MNKTLNERIEDVLAQLEPGDWQRIFLLNNDVVSYRRRDQHDRTDLSIRGASTMMVGRTAKGFLKEYEITVETDRRARSVYLTENFRHYIDVEKDKEDHFTPEEMAEYEEDMDLLDSYEKEIIQ